MNARSGWWIGVITAAIGLYMARFFSDVPGIAVAVVVAVPLVAYLMSNEASRDFITRALVGEEAAADQHGWMMLGIGFAILALTILWLEWSEPFYFTQDDNLAILPVTIAGARSLVLHGIFPTFNPYQYLGQPTSVQSIYALTYPFTYLAFAVAHLVGDDNAFVEVFVILHLVASYFATWWAARTCGVRPLLASLAAIAVPLAGATLIISRSYAQMSPVVVWMPLLIGLVERYRRAEVGFGWAAATGAVIALFCHCGNGQMWIYGMMFLALALLILMSRRNVVPAIVALLIGIALSLPLIIPQMWFMRGVPREGSVGVGIERYMSATLLPIPFAHAEHPVGWGRAEYMASFYYDGTLFTASAYLAILVLVGIVLACRWTAKPAWAIVKSNVWLGCAFFALLIAMGEHGGLWDLMSLLPVFHMFTGPWKLLIFFHIFAAMASCVILERLLQNRKLEWIGFAIVAFLIVSNANMARTAFYNYGDKPYPRLPQPMKQLLYSDMKRVLPVASDRDPDPGYVFSLQHHFATLYEVPSLIGYDPFVSITPENTAVWDRVQADVAGTLRTYGVRWVVAYRATDNFGKKMMQRIEHGGGRPVMQLPWVRIYEIDGASALAFPESQPQHELPIELSQRGVDLDVTGLRRVVLNFLDRRGIVILGDGALLPHAHDSFGRITVDVPPGVHHLALRFDPKWKEALAASAVTLLLACAIAAARRYFFSS